MAGMSSISPLGFMHVLLAAYCFTKWTELVPLRAKDSREIALRLRDELVARFGPPRFTRVDVEKQFAGKFRKKCSMLWIALRVASASIPQSNGQAE